VRVEDVYDPEEEQRRLFRILGPRVLELLRAWHQWVADQLQLSVEAFRLDDATTRKFLAYAAERVVLIDAAGRRAVQEQLTEGQRRGYSAYELAHGVPAEEFRGIKGLYEETWRGRSETIARTEIATASVAAGLDRYAATGMVDAVQIIEHEDTDAPCAARNGQVVPIASKPGLLHPNCQMSYVPIVNEAA